MQRATLIKDYWPYFLLLLLFFPHASVLELVQTFTGLRNAQWHRASQTAVVSCQSAVLIAAALTKQMFRVLVVHINAAKSLVIY